MKVKFGSIVVDARNKIGGHVASKNKYGSYFRTKVTPSNPQTSYQMLIRNRLTSISQAWKGLTAAQRTAWNAATQDFKKTDIFGDLQTLSGIALFSKLNNNLLTIGESMLTSPPVPATVGAFTSLSLAVDGTSETVTVTFSPSIPADSKVKLFATAPQSPGKNFVKSEFRLIKVLASTDSSPLDVSSDYIARFGGVGEAGQKVFIAAEFVNVSTGQSGSRLIASAIVS